MSFRAKTTTTVSVYHGGRWQCLEITAVITADSQDESFDAYNTAGNLSLVESYGPDIDNAEIEIESVLDEDGNEAEWYPVADAERAIETDTDFSALDWREE